MGLLKAINGFDPGVTPELAGYAQACVSGEIKRYFRDKRWQLRVRRADQELMLRARAIRADLAQQLGRAPADAEVARQLEVTVEELEAADAAAGAFAPASLDAEVAGAGGLTLGDVLGEEDQDLERAVDLEALSGALGRAAAAGAADPHAPVLREQDAGGGGRGRRLLPDARLAAGGPRAGPPAAAAAGRRGGLTARPGWPGGGWRAGSPAGRRWLAGRKPGGPVSARPSGPRRCGR